MKFLNHIEEIKNRFYLILASFTSLITVTLYYQRTLLYLTVKPSLYLFQEDSFYFIFTNLTEIFLTYLSLNVFVSLNITMLLLLVQSFFFFTPIWYSMEYHIVKSKIIRIVWFWMASFLITYYILVPFSWNFFFNFQNLSNDSFIKFFDIYFEARISEYVDFFIMIQTMCTFSLLIMLLFFSLLTKNNDLILKVKESRKYIFFLFFFVSALISPPEVLVQLFLGILICTLFEILLLDFLLKKNYNRNHEKSSKLIK